mgnify:CR=1 FL=1
MERGVIAVIVISLLLILMTTAVIYDFKTDKIPNWINVLGVTVGLGCSVCSNGLNGALYSLLGVIIPIGILFVLHRFGKLGAGDIKFLAMVGSFFGINILYVIIYSFLFGGIISLIIILSNMFKTKKLKVIHFSLEILLGAVTVFFVKGGLI